MPLATKNKQTNKKTEKGGAMEDVVLRRLRDAADAEPDNGAVQEALNTALSRMDIIRTFVSGEWIEWKHVRSGYSYIPARITERRSVIVPDTPLSELIRARNWTHDVLLLRQAQQRADPGPLPGSISVYIVKFEGFVLKEEIMLWFVANGLQPASLKVAWAFDLQAPRMPGHQIVAQSTSESDSRCLDLVVIRGGGVFPADIEKLWGETLHFASVRIAPGTSAD